MFHVLSLASCGWMVCVLSWFFGVTFLLALSGFWIDVAFCCMGSCVSGVEVSVWIRVWFLYPVFCFVHAFVLSSLRFDC